MTVRPAVVATVKLLKEVAAARADRHDPGPGPGPRRGPADQFDRRPGGDQHASGGANDKSGGGDPKGGTHISW